MPHSAFTDSYRRFQRILVTARKSKGMSQDALAKLLKKPQSFVSKYERGERRIDVVEFLDVAKALELDPVEVISQL